MYNIWTRLHNFYAEEINILGKSKPNVFPSIAAGKLNRDKIIFEEARKIVIAILQRIAYDEWLPKVADIPQYVAYDPSMNATKRHGCGTVAFRFGHTLVRNNFEQLNSNYVPVSEGPWYVRASFFNNLPIVENGIEPIMYGLFGDNGDAEDFNNTFSASVG